MLVNGSGGLFAAAEMVCHCLLVETRDGLVLVDTGLGRDDLRDPRGRLGRLFVAAVRPVLEPSGTAVAQVERLGYSRRDVRHVVLTHMDLDHAGGLADFPEAAVHVYADEHRAATRPVTRLEKHRYRACQWQHSPHFVLHETDGEGWRGFASVRALVEPDVLLLPLAGHTRGHAAVAIDAGNRFLVHAGDGYFHRDEVGTPPRCPPALRWFQAAVAVDDRARRANQARLRELASTTSTDEVSVFCAHDPVELERHVLSAASSAVGSPRP